MRRMVARIALALVVATVGCADQPASIPDTCNGRLDLCARRFDQVAYPTTHNAMSNEDAGWINPNQRHGIARQLDDGVRALMLDTHYDTDFEPALCHGLCQLGSTPLVEGLADIERFLSADDHRGDVVSIIFETYISAEDTAAAFDAAGLLDYVRAQPRGEPWPTLRELIDADQRLVVFTDADGGAYPWYLDVWAFAWETPFSNRDASDFTCDINRGSSDNDLFILNHFLTQTIPKPELAEQVNVNPLFIDRAMQCMTASGRLPNFVTVDFYSIGDLFAVVDALDDAGP